MKHKLKLFYLLLFMIISNFAFAQITASGNVTDGSGPLPGVTVMEKGTSNGTVTDFDGNYSLTVSSGDATLVISYIGFETQELSAGADSFDVALTESADELDEVVVTGYGTQKKATLTGSIATIGGDEL